MGNQKFGANAKTTFLAKTGSVVGGMLAKQKCLTKVSCLQEKKRNQKMDGIIRNSLRGPG